MNEFCPESLSDMAYIGESDLWNVVRLKGLDECKYYLNDCLDSLN